MKALLILGALLLPLSITHATTVAPVKVEIQPIRADYVIEPLPPVRVSPPSDGEGITPVYLDIGGVDGDTGSAKGSVEFEWKVEEGENLMDDEEPVTPDFGILLGGGSGASDDERAKGLQRALEVIQENARASDQAIESISLNFEKIQTKVKTEVKLFGFIPVSTTATVEVDELANAEVSYPWWTFLASGKDDTVGARVVTMLSNILKTKHDTIKNSIQNVR